MTLLFMDGFGTSNSTTYRYTNYKNAPTWNATYGRYSTPGITTVNDTQCVLSIPAQQTIIWGGAVKFSGIQNYDGTSGWLQFRTGSTNQIEICLASGSATMYVTRAGSSLGSSANGTFVFQQDIWYYIEVKAYFHGSAGTVMTRVNGVTDINLTGANTSNSGTTANTVWYYVKNASMAGYYLDDTYVCDTNGSVNNDFLGDVRIETLMPSGAGNTTQWTRGGSDSGANWSQVEESTPNGDTDYVQSGTVGNKDTYAYGDLVTTAGTVGGVQPLLYARKDNAGSRTIVPVYRSGGTDYDGTGKAVTDSYTYLSEIKEQNPATSSSWTIADVNAAEFGVKVSA